VSPSFFLPIRLRMLAFEHQVETEVCAEKLAVIKKLSMRIEDGTLAGLVETRAEQSFNERLFAEVFDYMTLLRDGVDAYHLLPKGGVVVGRKRHYDDFSLGFFGLGADVRLLHAEFKGYPTNLDKVQTGGGHRGQTPIEQAFDAATKDPNVQWVLVSNFDEMRLYHRTDRTCFERVLLSDIVSNDDLRCAHVLLSRRTLLGTSGHASPLLQMFNGGHPMLLPTQPHCVRLVHEARALVSGDEEASLPAMDDAFRAALAAVPPGPAWDWYVPRDVDPEYANGRLVIDTSAQASMPIRVEYTRDGVVRLQEYLPNDHDAAKSSVVVSADDVARHVGMFLGLSSRMLTPVFPGPLAFRWSVLDGTSLTILRPNRGPLLSKVDEVTTKEFQPDAKDPGPATRSHIAGYLSKALKELLFPWEHKPTYGRVERIDWTDQRMENVLEQLGM
jgi:hypothetical protein